MLEKGGFGPQTAALCKARLPVDTTKGINSQREFVMQTLALANGRGKALIKAPTPGLLSKAIRVVKTNSRIPRDLCSLFNTAGLRLGTQNISCGSLRAAHPALHPFCAAQRVLLPPQAARSQGRPQTRQLLLSPALRVCLQPPTEGHSPRREQAQHALPLSGDPTAMEN